MLKMLVSLNILSILLKMLNTISTWISIFFVCFFQIIHLTLTKRLEKKLDGNYCQQYWTSPRGNTPQSPTIKPPASQRKLSKLDEPDMQDSAG